MVLLGPYPLETSFYPGLIITPFITLGVFNIMLYLIATIKIRKDKSRGTRRQQSPTVNTDSGSLGGRLASQIKDLPGKVKREHITDVKIGDYVAMAALVATIVAFAIPLIQIPILDYTIEGPFPTNKQNVQQLKLTISNVGIATGEHIIVSLNSDNTKFLGFSSQPFLGRHVNDSLTNKVGNGLLDIDNLPAGSHTVIIFYISNSVDDKPESELSTYVRSSKVVASHQSYNMLIFYSILFAVYTIFVVIFSTGMIIPTTKDNQVNYQGFIVIGIIIASGIVTGNMLLSLPNLSSNDMSYRINYYIGPILVPVVILILSLIFLKLKSEEEDKVIYRAISCFALTTIFLLSAITIFTYLPNIEKDSIFNQLSYWGLFVCIVGAILTIPVVLFYTWLARRNA